MRKTLNSCFIGFCALFMSVPGLAGDQWISSTVHSSDWLRSGINDIHTHVNIDPVTETVHLMHVELDVPMAPPEGVDPMELFYFLWCVGGRMSDARGYEEFALGTTEPDKQFDNVSRLELYMTLLESGEPPGDVPGESIHWYQTIPVAKLVESLCSGFIKREYLW